MKANRDRYYSDFDPRVPAGCALWLDGGDSNSMTLISGSNVSVWNDKSGMSNHASQTTSANRPIFNGSGLVFDGANSYMQISNPSIRPTNMYVVVNSSTAGAIFQKGSATPTDLEFYIRYNGSPINLLATWVVSGGGSMTSGGAVTSGATNILGAAWNEANTFVYSNATQIDSDALAGVQFVATTGATDARIGARFSGTSNNSTPATFFNGTIYEIVAYSNPLTTANRQAVEGYLARKWGLQSNLPVTHAYRTLTPFARPMIPPDLGNSENWFDAADVDTITSSGGILSEWKNKGVICRAFEATVQNGSPTTGTASQNGLNCIGLASNAVLKHQDAAVNYTTQPRSQFFATRPTLDTTAGGGGTLSFKFQGGAASGGNDAIIFYSGGKLAELAQGVAFQIETGAIANQQNTFGLYTFVNAATTARNRIALDGNSISLITNNAAANYNQSTNLSNYVNLTVELPNISANVGSQELGEWVGFRSELWPAEVQEMEGYLAWKWGNRASLPSAHLYRNLAPYAVAFNPRMFGSCALWLDAMDASSIKVTSGAVEAWMDKSGNNRNISQATAANRPAYVATNLQDPYVEFTAASSHFIDLSDAASLAVGRSFSAFIVEDRTATGFNFFMGGSSGTTNNNLILGYFNDTTGLMAFLANDLPVTVPSFSTNTEIRIWDFVYTRPGREIWIDGVMQNLDTNATDLAGWTGAALGRYQAGSSFYSGTIREILWYTPALTSNERSMVEGYLAHKWNRKGSLSFGHPFKKVIP